MPGLVSCAEKKAAVLARTAWSHVGQNEQLRASSDPARALPLPASLEGTQSCSEAGPHFGKPQHVSLGEGEKPECSDHVLVQHLLSTCWTAGIMLGVARQTP